MHCRIWLQFSRSYSSALSKLGVVKSTATHLLPNTNTMESISTFLSVSWSTHFLQMLFRTEEFPMVILRLFLTYGPGQEDRRFLPQIIKGCLSDAKFPTSEGQQLRDFCCPRHRSRHYDGSVSEDAKVSIQCRFR